MIITTEERQNIIKEIDHAFADASVNMFGETEDENRREFREMLEMHTNITQEHYGVLGEKMSELVVEVATEIGAKEAYDWAYGLTPPKTKASGSIAGLRTHLEE
jgi:hypothetical protein